MYIEDSITDLMLQKLQQYIINNQLHRANNI